MQKVLLVISGLTQNSAGKAVLFLNFQYNDFFAFVGLAKENACLTKQKKP